MTLLDETPDTRYLQLADTLAEAIRRGTLQPGDRLPSVRRCAQTHRVSINTVVSAYRTLEDRGLIEARPQSGFYVRSTLPALKMASAPSSRIEPPADDVLALIDTVFAAQQNPASPTLRWPARRPAISIPAANWGACCLPNCAASRI